MSDFGKRAVADERGSTAIIFALAMVPLLMAAGAAVDYSRASDLLSRLQAGTDAAALMLCKSTATNSSDLQASAQRTIAPYVPNSTVAISNFSVTSTPRAVRLTASTSQPTSFMKIANVTSVPVGATAACSSGETFYEIALVLDTTGSMLNSSGSTTKLQALQSAATDFVNYMFDNAQSGHLKISIVPFSASVKVNPATYATASWLDLAGRSSLHWQNASGAAAAGFTNRLDVFRKLAAVNSNWGWAGCIESLPYPLNTQDGAPSASNVDSYYLPMFAPDEVGTTISGSQDVSSNNSYIDDGTSTSGACDSNNSNQTTRLGQACKYVTPRNARASQYGPNFMCDSRPLTRLTATKTTLLNEINALTAGGSTNIHEGVMWGWRTLSPLSVFADGAAYTSPNTQKVIVLMTDGENQWLGDSANPVTKSYYSAYGFFYNADGSRPNARLPSGNANPTGTSDGRDAIDALTRTGCTNASRNATIYTIGFSTPGDPIDATGLALLRDCAGSSDRFFQASNSTALTSAFSSIAKGIGQLRLTQ